MDRYDKAMERLDADLENDLISDKEYQDEMRELHAEMRQQAEDAALNAYYDVMGRF